MIGHKQRGERRGACLTQWLMAFARQAGGNVAMMFGMALPLLLMVALGTIDIHQASRVKANLQDGLDAAALAAARSPHTDPDAIQKVGIDALKANMPDYFALGSGDTATFTLEDNVLVADARVNVKVLVANIVMPPYGKLLEDYLPVSSHSEVLRASRNVEVGLALDVTLSMQGQPLNALKEAATELVELVVQDQQSPFYSKLGIVPYASGVNLGTANATLARGPVRAATAIQSARWTEDTGKSLSAITKATQAEVTSVGHGLSDNQVVIISGVSGMTDVNNRFFRVSRTDANKFKLKTLDGTAFINSLTYRTYTGSGTVRKCLDDSCGLVVASTNHGLTVGEMVYLDKLSGLTDLNAKYYKVEKIIDGNRFSLRVPSFSAGVHTANTGRTWCASEGCEYFYFTNTKGVSQGFPISSCVTERTGPQAYTDAAPSTALFGRNYPSATAVCPSSVVTPMSSSRPLLTKAIDDLKVEGTTGGQIGVAWAWNMVSPRFASFWGGASAPGPHDPLKTLKVVILMTDGEFNSPYCKGVLATDATVINLLRNENLISNCPSPNGNPFTQAVRLCEAMKADGIIVYTVGFNLDRAGNNTSAVDTAIEVMETCATTKNNHFHDTKSGADLREAFRAIGRDITRLRLAR